MKILVVCGAGKMYGREVVTLSLMKELRDRGHQLACLTSTWSDGKFQKQVESLSIPCTSAALGFISKQLDWSAFRMTLVQLIKLPVLWVRYRRTLKSFRPDVVLHSDFHHVFLLWPLLGAARNVFHVHDYFAPTRFYSRMFRLLCRRLDTVVAVSHFIGESLTRVGIPEDRIKCVLNGISLDKADGRAQDVAVSRQVRSEMCKPRVGIV
ncbi:MAG: glycosyltransferase, partial [Pyrinomonadaceae bacterium]